MCVCARKVAVRLLHILKMVGFLSIPIGLADCKKMQAETCSLTSSLRQTHVRTPAYIVQLPYPNPA